MPALAPVILVAVLSFAAFATDSFEPAASTQLAAIGGAIDVPTSPSTASLGTSPGAVDPQIADKQCVPETAGRKYFKTTDRTKWNTIVQDPTTKTEFFNLYGKPCKGPIMKGAGSPVIDAFCSKANYCDGSMPGTKCTIEGKVTDCKQYAVRGMDTATAMNNGTMNDGSILGKVSSEPKAPIDTKTPVTGNDVTKAAYEAPKVPTSQPAPTSPVRTESPIKQIDAIGATNPASQQSIPASPLGQTTKEPIINPATTRNVVTNPVQSGPIQTGQVPTGKFPTGATTGINPTRTGPIAQNTFSRSPLGGSPLGGSNPITPSPTRSSGSSFGRLLTNFSIASIFSGMTNALNSVVNSATQPKQTVVQNTTVVNVTPQPAVQQTPRNTQLPTPQLSNFNPGQFAENLGTTPLTIEEITRGTSVTARDIGKAVNINIPDIADTSASSSETYVGETPFYTITPAPISASSSVSAEYISAPAFFTASATSSLDSVESIRGAFTQRIDGLEPIKITNGEFHAEKPVQRTTSVVELFTEINIPDIFTALVEAPADFFRKLLGRGTPEARIVTTDRGSAPVPTFDNEPAPAFDGSSETSPASTATGGSGAVATTQGQMSAGSQNDDRVRAAITERLEKEPEAAFREVSPVHRGDSYVPPAKPGNIYPDVLPVPTKKDAPSQAPGVLELVVKNGAKELKNLFTTLKNVILPPR